MCCKQNTYIFVLLLAQMGGQMWVKALYSKGLGFWSGFGVQFGFLGRNFCMLRKQVRNIAFLQIY